MTSVLVVGGGIGGLAAALSLHEMGITVQVVEAAHELLPLGVGINLQPHAVRELTEMGLQSRLADISVAPNQLIYTTKRGQNIWTEPRGTAAGYRWPQLSVHRGLLQKLLHDTVSERLGADCVRTGARVVRLEDQAVVLDDGSRLTADVIVGADGIHSVVRQQLNPEEPPPRWNGNVLWRGICTADPVGDGRSLVWAGHPQQKFVMYPIEDLPDGRQKVNVIAELRCDAAGDQDWEGPGQLSEVLPQFASWNFGWMDCASLLGGVEQLYRYPMTDRDPLATWTRGRVTLLGDAAHPMYPIGSNGASQAILDARVLAACLATREPADALLTYEAVRRPATTRVALANRQLGPEKPMQLVESRAPDGFAQLEDVITVAELAALSLEYKQLSGFDVDELNTRSSLIKTRW